MIFFSNVSMWGYRFGFTAAQIELAVSDAPFIKYNHKDDKKKFKKVDALAIYEAQKRVEDRQAKTGEKGKHFSLENYNK